MRYKFYQWVTIVKLQRPLFTTGKHQNVFVYNYNRSIEQEFRINKMTRKLFGDEYKIYCSAVVDKNWNLNIVEKIDEQVW